MTGIQHGAEWTSTGRKVQRELVDAVKRGVEVTVITEQKQERYSVTDERVEQAGGTVIRARHRVGEYSAMHHK